MGLNTFQTSGSSPTTGIRKPECPVALLGFGPLGQALARRLTGPDSPLGLQLTHICDRRAREKSVRESEAIAALHWTDRFDDLLTSDAHILVEAVSGPEPSADYIRAALLAGKAVVTVNRQVIAHHGPALLTVAERQGRQLRYEGAVGGGNAHCSGADRWPVRRTSPAHRRDSERHEQRRSVTHGGRRVQH